MGTGSPLRVVGAGLGRTGTHSLKVALEQLLGGPCYHMLEVFSRPEHARQWHGAFNGRAPDWDVLFDGFVATVDWPAAACWRELIDVYSDSLVLLSVRASADEWWRSADRTIFERFRVEATGDDPWRAMADAMLERFTPHYLDEAEAKAAYERHNADVRATVPPERLLEWRATDGWGPLCEALGVDVPDVAFPVTNTTAEFRARAGFDSQT